MRLLQRLPDLHTLDLVDVEDLSSDVLKVRFLRSALLYPNDNDPHRSYPDPLVDSLGSAPRYRT